MKISLIAALVVGSVCAANTGMPGLTASADPAPKVTASDDKKVAAKDKNKVLAPTVNKPPADPSVPVAPGPVINIQKKNKLVVPKKSTIDSQEDGSFATWSEFGGPRFNLRHVIDKNKDIDGYVIWAKVPINISFGIVWGASY